MTNGEDYPSLMRLLQMLESDLLPLSASQASADSSDTAVTSADQHPGSVNAAPTSGLIATRQLCSGQAISSTDSSLEGTQATGAAAPTLTALPPAVLPPVAPPQAAPPPAVLPSVAPPLAAPPVAALPLAAPPVAAAVLPPVAPPLAAPPMAALPQEQPAILPLDALNGITTAIMRPEQPADVTSQSNALPGVELTAQFEKDSQTRSSTGVGMSEPDVIIEQLIAMLRVAESDLQALGTGTEDPLPQISEAEPDVIIEQLTAMLHAAQADLQALGIGTEDPLRQISEAVAGEELTSEAGQEARADMPASQARMNAAASDGKAAYQSDASPQAHRRPLATP